MISSTPLPLPDLLDDTPINIIFRVRFRVAQIFVDSFVEDEITVIVDANDLALSVLDDLLFKEITAQKVIPIRAGEQCGV